ncbi:hypothetical protein ODJ79_22580 [Actinoplanes sp. KI2]|uniref:hypothetical protein n=1 Tax=Actinoplanes sp. KI2 TaxID=2983315 RepID=UPI0021D5FFB4|nr:hypothetical protein [Actinoplanes sp. KI2]MCU7726527.1 hypothetical protein [Actinoplanes sp. KI2]
MLLWIWIAVVVIGLVVLTASTVPLLGRLGELRRAAAKLQRRRQEATKLQAKVQVLQETVLEVQQRAETTQSRLAGITNRQ